MPDDTLAHYVRHWNLREDGAPFTSSSGILQPVLSGEIKCMLKIARREKDRRANQLMVWWDGDGGSFSDCSRIADSLLQDQQDIVALHGDIHHGNVLDFDDRGWLAIDPKGLLGDRGFDYANIFCNPYPATALQPGRLFKQATIVAQSAGLDRTRLLHWTVAWAGLSAAWCIADGEDPKNALAVASLALHCVVQS